MMQRVLDHPVGRALAIYAALMLLLLLAILLLRPVLLPLGGAFVVFSILDPIKNRLQRRGLNEKLAIALVLSGLIASGVLMLVMGVPALLEQWSHLQASLPVISNEISKLTMLLSQSVSASIGVPLDTQPGRWMEKAQGWGTDAVVSSAGIMMQSLVSLVLVPLVSFFLLRDYRRTRNHVMNWLPNRAYELGWLIYYRVTHKLSRYVRSVFIQSAIIAVVASVGFYLIGLDTAVLFGILTGLLNLIPYLGPLLALVPPLLSSFAAGTPPDVWVLLSIVAVVLVAQLVDNFIVVPSLIAHTVDLHPLLVLLGVVVFGYFFGFIGMLVAIPLLAASKIILKGLIKGLRGDLAEDVIRS